MADQQKVYFWAPGAQRSVDSQVVGATIDQIAQQKGVCHPQDLVDTARPDDSPLHPLFEWDNEVAADLFRRDQARQIIRMIRPRFVDDDKPSDVPAFVHVRLNGQDGYMRTDHARAQDEVWAEVLEDALAQLTGLQKRYQHLQELTEVWDAIGRVKTKAKAGFRRKALQPAGRTK